MPEQTTTGGVLADLDVYLGEIREKRAAEAGDTGTTHPSKGVDDQTRPATEGARSAENEADVKADVPGESVDEASEAEAETPAKPVAMTTAKTTGEDPSNETSSAKGDKEDGTTTHPADAETVGEKYSSFDELASAIGKDPEKVACDLGNALMADIAVLIGEHHVPEKAAGAEAAPAEAPREPEGEATEEELQQIAEAGYKTAAEVHAALEQGQQQITREMVDMVVKEAASDAKMVVSYFEGLKSGAEESVNPPRGKRAAEDEEPKEEEAAPKPEEPPAPAAGAEDATLPPEDISALAAAANEPPAREEGAAPAAAPEEMPPEIGGAPEEMLGGLGDVSDEEVVEALSEALAEAGVTPEELAQAVAGEQAGMEVTAGEKAAAVSFARESVAKVNEYRKLQKEGKAKKKASIDLKYGVRQLVKQYLGK